MSSLMSLSKNLLHVTSQAMMETLSHLHHHFSEIWNSPKSRLPSGFWVPMALLFNLDSWCAIHSPEKNDQFYFNVRQIFRHFLQHSQSLTSFFGKCWAKISANSHWSNIFACTRKLAAARQKMPRTLQSKVMLATASRFEFMLWFTFKKSFKANKKFSPDI